MKRFRLALLALCFVLIPPASAGAIDIWHSNTFWINRGICAYVFALDGQDMQFEDPPGMGDVTLEIVLLDKDLEEIEDPLAVRLDGPLADCEATRYRQFTLEGDCNAETFGISKATGVIDGELVDLLDTGKITPRKFEPVKIILPDKYSEK